MHIVHIGLPVLHKASVVCRHHPCAIVTPFHTAYRTVVALQRNGRETSVYNNTSPVLRLPPSLIPRPKEEEEKGPGNEANSHPAFCSTTTSRYSCVTCRIDSKLKVRPFQRVNSPLTAPVISRLPSGTHCRGSRFSSILVSVPDLNQPQRGLLSYIEVWGRDHEVWR